MSIAPADKLQEELKARFNCVEYWETEPDVGLKRLRISGQFIRTVGLDEWVPRVKALLPADAKLILWDDAAIRMAEPNDIWLMFFGSKTWEIVPEGEIVPALQPLFLNEKIPDNPVFDLQVINPIPAGVELRLVINKHTHALLVPKEEETDEGCVVIVRPKE